MKVQLDYKLTMKQEKKTFINQNILHTVTQVNDLLVSCNNGTYALYTTLSVLLGCCGQPSVDMKVKLQRTAHAGCGNLGNTLVNSPVLSVMCC